MTGALAASLALLLVVPLQTTPTIEHELVESHVRSMLADHLIDVKTSDRHVVRPWFNGKIDFAPRVPELSPARFPLVGGRLDYVGDRVVAALVYRRRQHTINLFVWPQPAEMPTERELQGYSLAEWSEGNLRYGAVSDVDRNDLGRFRTAFQKSAGAGGDEDPSSAPLSANQSEAAPASRRTPSIPRLTIFGGMLACSAGASVRLTHTLG
jgi:anti-sigma factor RsiW